MYIYFATLPFYCIFDQINAALVCTRDLFLKHEKVLLSSKF